VVPPSAAAVVLVRFPFSDLSHTKVRPALVLANAGRGHWILCQITSNPYGDLGAIPISDTDFQAGSLRAQSFARPAKLFTANEDLIVGQVGRLAVAAFHRVVDSVVLVLRSAEADVSA
jgi:mRNA interferase MazF